MSRASVEENPTMLIPKGTRIEVDTEGKLSITAPGNLVVQNSGKYGTLESLSGSIRIDRGAEVEAVAVRCAETCFVQGFLTAWKVSAKLLHLEDSARAHIVLQETRRLQIGRDARLVGNFSSEKEIFSLFSRFANQVRALPHLFDRRPPQAELAPGNEDVLIESGPEPRPEPRQEETTTALSAPPTTPPPLAALPEPLLLALVLLEGETDRKIHVAAGQRAMDELIKLLQQQDLETLQHTWRILFGRIDEPREQAQRARELVGEYFGARAG
jgi:hypothetical protein